MIKKILFLIFLSCFALLSTVVSSVAIETLTIDGTGDSQSLLRKMASQFEKLHEGTQIVVPDSIGSGGGIKAIAANKTGLARTARKLKDKEKAGLTEIPFGKSPVVFAVNASVSGISGLSSAQIIQIYTGKITNWKQVGGTDGKIYAVTREVGDSSRKVLEKSFEGFKGIQMKAKEFFTTPETAAAIKDHANTIGYVPLSTAKEYNLHVLAVDGKNPNDASGEEYPYTATFFLIKNESPSPLALKFIDFVQSEEGKKIMTENGVVPLP